MIGNKLVLSVAASFSLLGVTAPGSANVIAPPEKPAARHTSKLLKLNSGPAIVLIGPSGCSSDGYDYFIGGGYANYAGYYSDVPGGASNESCDSYTAIAGGYQNTIGGDGSSGESAISGGYSNAIEAGYSFIGAGNNNTIAKVGSGYNYTSYASAIVAGVNNVVASYGSFIGAGTSNTVVGTNYSFVGAGYNNSVSSNYATIGAGENNTITADSSTIAGGIQNSISNIYSTIGGGYLNTVAGQQATIGGGYGNSASGKDAAIPGGSDNVASGPNTFAAGSHAEAATQGSFVWADTASTSLLASTVANEFLARATGGFYLESSTKGNGVKLAPGSGAWSTLSDRNVKSNIEPVDPAQILNRLDALPVSEWSYTAEGSVRHLGPMAQDFRAAFNLGEDDTTISTVDEEGVALAAIKALKAENDAKDGQIAELRDEHLKDQARFARLEARLDALEKNSHS